MVMPVLACRGPSATSGRPTGQPGVAVRPPVGVPQAPRDGAVEDAGLGEQRVEGAEQRPDVVVLIEPERIEAGPQAVQDQIIGAKIAQPAAPIGRGISHRGC